MKKFGLLYFIPLFIAMGCLYFGKAKINTLFFEKELSVTIDSSYRYLDNFKNNKFYEDQFLLSNDSTETIFLLGSSELTDATEAIPYNFINNNFKTKLRAIGHAGNQCFSIYSQLLANENRLKDAPIVIIISPSWFQSTNAKGTTSPLFLEFNSIRFLNNILQNNSISIFKQYESERISDFYNEIGNPDLSLKLLVLENKYSENIFQRLFYFPIIEIDKVLNSMKFEFMYINNKNTNTKKINRKPIISEQVTINWDSLFNNSKQEQINNSTNNNWCVDSGYYNKYINGKNSSISPVNEEDNQELKDFIMLIKLLKTQKANASFIIIPLNSYYYTNLNQLSPLVNTLETEITRNNFPILNLWNADTNKFEKGILKDVMHLGKYGWYKVDKFIVETYKLAK